MPEINRTRDAIVFVKGVTITVNVDDLLVTDGWSGGVGAEFVESVNDEILVTRSDGFGSGFLLWGSDEVPDDFTAMTRNQPTYRFAVLCVGGWLFSTSSYEKYTWASRQAGPLVPISYTASDRLRFSLRGLWTNEDEWTLSGDARAPNNNQLGLVAQAPSPANNNFLTIQVTI